MSEEVVHMSRKAFMKFMDLVEEKKLVMERIMYHKSDLSEGVEISYVPKKRRSK